MRVQACIIFNMISKLSNNNKVANISHSRCPVKMAQ